MEQPSNGELALMIQNVATDVSEIKVQTTATNGRVSKLEAAKNMAVGGLIITNVIILPIALTLIIQYLKK